MGTFALDTPARRSVTAVWVVMLLSSLASLVASFVYHAANRDQLLPRKPMPKPASPQPTGSTRQ